MTFVREVDDDRAYPVDFVIWRLTRWRPEASDFIEGLPGDALRADLVTLVQRVSHRVPSEAASGEVLSADEVAQALGVSRRSVERMRASGLVMTYWRAADGQRRLGCRRDDLEWFVQVSNYQKPDAPQLLPVDRIEARAVALGAADSREATARAIVQEDPALSMATIRGVLRRLEARGAIERSAQRRLTQRQQSVGLRAWWRGVPVSTIADRFEIGRAAMHRALLRNRTVVLSEMAAAWSMDGQAAQHSDIGTVPWDVQATFYDAYDVAALEHALQTYQQSACWYVMQSENLVPQPSAIDLDRVEVAMRVAMRWRWTATVGLMPLLTRVVTIWAHRDPQDMPPTVRRRTLIDGTRLLYESVPSWCGLSPDRLEARVMQAIGAMMARLPAFRHDLAHSRVAHEDGIFLRSFVPPMVLVPDPRWERAAMQLGDGPRSLVMSRWGLGGQPSRTLQEVATMHGVTTQAIARRWASAQRQLTTCARESC